MPRMYQNSAALSDGRRIGYSLFKRGSGWYVRFVDGSGKRVKKSLGKPTSQQWGRTAPQAKIANLQIWMEMAKKAEELIRMMYFVTMELELD